MTRFALAGLCLLTTCATWPAASATITVRTATDRDFSVIFIEGDLQFGDEKKFKEHALKVQNGVVVLGSDGGNLFAGLEIGRAIRLLGLRTLVPDGAQCASACAIAWLAGVPRFMGPRARVGFHAAYELEDGESKVSGPANAVAGAYLNMLGLPDRAIRYIASAPPEGMTWLSFKDAEKVGIEVKPFDLPPEAKEPVISQPKSTGPGKSGDANTDRSAQEQQPPSAPKTALIEPPLVPQPKLTEPGPLETDAQLLDLADSKAASQVQRRLQVRGFFAGVVDGVWEAKSRIALVDFKVLNGLGFDDGWDLRVQRALFDDRSRAAPPDYTPYGTKPSVPSAPRTAAVEPQATTQQPEFPSLGAPRLEPQVLDLARADAASQVQRRLQERGFLVGSVDGVWGVKSRIALRDFKSFNGMSADDSWNLRVQLALFDDRYRAAPAGYNPPDSEKEISGLFQPFPAPSGATLHPLNVLDAEDIQSRLSELGYYHGQGDGIWGMASQSALHDFKVANGLAANDAWDSSVQSVLLNGHAVPAAETPFGEWARADTSCSGPRNLGRLFVSAKEIIAGQGVCQMEQSLVRSGDVWSGIAKCSRTGDEAVARVAFKMTGGRLVDQSVVGSVPNSRPPAFERCR